MAGPLYDLFFATHPVEFESDYSLAESVQRLRDVAGALRPAISGTVAETYVSIHRADPPTRHDFRPWFFGRFVERDGRIVLRGSYSLHEGVKIVAAVVLAACVFVTWRVVLAILDGTASPAMLLVPLAAFSIFAYLAWSGREATRDDPAWIEAVISNTLKQPIQLH